MADGGHGGHGSGDANAALVAALSGVPIEQAMLQQRAQRAQSMMGFPGAQGQQIGQVYRAASPLEHLANALMRVKGGREMKGIEAGFGDIAQRAQQGALAGARIERGDKDRAFGLQERGLERQTAADAAAQARAAAEAQATATYREQQLTIDRDRLKLDGARLGQDAWGAVADPVTGGIVLFNKKTGERMPLGPGGGEPKPAPGAGPLPPMQGKPTETQRNKVIGASDALAQLDLATQAFEKAPGAYGGAGNFVAALAEQAGGIPVQSLTGRRYTPDEQAAKNLISNVVSKIINERAGANVVYREELRQKFLPQDTDSQEQVRQKLDDLRKITETTYKAQGGPGETTAAAPQDTAAPPIRRFTRQNGKVVEVK
jgi:hypothetical protein